MSGLIFIGVLTVTFIFYIHRIGLKLSLTSVGLGLAIAIYGPFYFIYSRYWLFNDTWLYQWYVDSIGYSSLAASYYAKLASDPYTSTALRNLDLALSLLFAGFVVGTLAVDFMTKTTPWQFKSCLEKWNRQRFHVDYSSPLIASIQAVSVTIICLGLLGAYIHYDKPAAVYHYFFSNASEAEKIKWRISSGGFPYFWALFLSSIGTFLSIYFISQSRKRGAAAYTASICFIVLILFGKMAYLSKAPALVFVIQLAIAVIVHRTLKPNWMIIASLVLLGLGSMVAMVFVANSELTRLQAALAFLFYRVFMIPNESLLEYFLVFPHRLPHTMGIDNKFIAALVGVEKIPESYFRVAESIRGVGGSTTNGLFIADAWAEFKWWGVVAFPMIFGAILRYTDVLVVKRIGKTPISIAAIVTGYYGVFIALNTSLFTACLTGGLALILPLVWVYSRIRPRQERTTVEPIGKDNAYLPE
jgi:hypothetical protein